MKANHSAIDDAVYKLHIDDLTKRLVRECNSYLLNNRTATYDFIVNACGNATLKALDKALKEASGEDRQPIEVYDVLIGHLIMCRDLLANESSESAA